MPSINRNKISIQETLRPKSAVRHPRRHLAPSARECLPLTPPHPSHLFRRVRVPGPQRPRSSAICRSHSWEASSVSCLCALSACPEGLRVCLPTRRSESRRWAGAGPGLPGGQPSLAEVQQLLISRSCLRRLVSPWKNPPAACLRRR